MPRWLTISYDKVSRLMKIDYDGFFTKKSSGRTCISITCHDASDSHSDIEAAKHSKGIIVLDDISGIRILNDPFCSIPLYYTETATNFYASSNPQFLIDYRTHTYDPVGVWESLLLHSPLWNRTPYKGVKFLPSACELKVVRETKISRYWNFEFEPSSMAFNKKAYLGALDDLINQKFCEIKADTLCMGLSGGNDSRLAAHYLALNKNRYSKIKLVTYAAHPNSYEFRYSCEVARTLGLEAPHLHLLDDSHYCDALNYLPQWSAGQINNLHCHLASYLKEVDAQVGREVHLSTYYTDAVFGYACGKPVNLSEIEYSSAYQDIMNASYIPSAIHAEILDDLRLALKPSSGADGYFSSLDELKYITERNPRFHISLAFIQHQFRQTALPFADIDVLQMVMKAPISFRESKGILTELLNHINPNLTNIGSSANTEYFYGSKSRLRNGNLFERAKFGKFRLLNMTTQLLSKLSGGTLRICNPFQTEDQVSLFRNSFSHVQPAVLADGRLVECLGGAAIERIFKDELILRNIAERFSLICFHHLSTTACSWNQPAIRT
jgi:hypothetical protein